MAKSSTCNNNTMVWKKLRTVIDILCITCNNILSINYQFIRNDNAISLYQKQKTKLSHFIKFGLRTIFALRQEILIFHFFWCSTKMASLIHRRGLSTTARICEVIKVPVKVRFLQVSFALFGNPINFINLTSFFHLSFLAKFFYKLEIGGYCIKFFDKNTLNVLVLKSKAFLFSYIKQKYLVERTQTM